MKKTLAVLMAVGLSTSALAGGVDDPLLSKAMINKMELRGTGGPDPQVLDAEAWVGYDLNKFWFKTDVERLNGRTTDAEVQFLYSRAITPFWDLQVGWRRDIKPTPQRDFLALGIKGLTPYLFDVDAGLFFGKSGQIAARLDAEYEYMLTQRLILSPEVAMNLYRKDDPAVGIGSGLSNMELGLRLRYEVRREFAPYIGVNWTRKFGQTADFARADGEGTSDVQFVVGIRAWF